MNEPTFTLLHDPVVDAFRLAGARPEAHKEVMNLLSDYTRIIGSELRFTELNGSPAFDNENGYADFTPESFVAHILRTRPHIFMCGPRKAPDSTTNAPAPRSSKTMSELMAEAKAGSTEAMQELIDKHMPKTAAAQTKQNLTQLMMKARDGDENAKRQLANGLK